ncbi:hypothetical protein [Carboxylicivirga sp. M1479]|uniref:hypothetical protein n=1 Tax=Carboxylicivirga sp. M1479 TaxID=2594476 RepID=UPI001177EE28|nr:hypothetical protein [Carboxylicivirga sp. M1479]TRX66318.1 hypothetical protein FNN09_14010 [Carboxylicivirga sp. M1479]
MNFKPVLIGILIFVGIFISSSKASATHQIPDYLVIETDTFELFSNPLTAYFNFKNEKKINEHHIKSLHSACWRGYIATWQLENDSLFLIKIEGKNANNEAISYDLKKEFGNTKVYAEWFTGTLISPRGNRLQYHNMAYASVYEKEMQYHVWNGKVKKEVIKHNLSSDNKRLYPADKFLQDTITKTIEAQLNAQQINGDNDKTSSALLVIQFNKDGKIEDWAFASAQDEKSLLGQEITKIAEAEFPKLPALMKVDHMHYQSPRIEVMIRNKPNKQ